MNRMVRFGGTLRAVSVAVLCGLFLLFATGLALFSSSVYENTVESSDETHIFRTSLSYISNQVRRGDVEGAIKVGKFSNIDAFSISENIGGSVYTTLFYCYEGNLMELFVEDGYSYEPEDGISIIELDDLKIIPNNESITFIANDGMKLEELTITPRCGFEEVESL